MAKENIENVFLTPDDISRAAVKNEEIGKLPVNQLKFWLICRRINQSGNKIIWFYYMATIVHAL